MGPCRRPSIAIDAPSRCAARPLAGSRFQQHLARETAPDAAPALAVFAINPTDAAWQREAISRGVLPRLGVAAMVAACARLGLPWAGYLPQALLLDADTDAIAEAGGSGGGGVLPAGVRSELEAAAAAGGPTVVAVRRCVGLGGSDEGEPARR